MKKLNFMLIIAFLFCSIQMVQAQTQPPRTRTRTNMDTMRNNRTNMDTIRNNRRANMDTMRNNRVDTMKNKWVGKDRNQTRNYPPQTSDSTRTRNGVAVIPGGGVKNGQTIGHVGATGYKHHHRLHHKYRHHVVSTKTKTTTKKPTTTTPKQPTPNP